MTYRQLRDALTRLNELEHELEAAREANSQFTRKERRALSAETQDNLDSHYRTADAAFDEEIP